MLIPKHYDFFLIESVLALYIETVEKAFSAVVRQGFFDTLGQCEGMEWTLINPPELTLHSQSTQVWMGTKQ